MEEGIGMSMGPACWIVALAVFAVIKLRKRVACRCVRLMGNIRQGNNREAALGQTPQPSTSSASRNLVRDTHENGTQSDVSSILRDNSENSMRNNSKSNPASSNVTLNTVSSAPASNPPLVSLPTPPSVKKPKTLNPNKDVKSSVKKQKPLHPLPTSSKVSQSTPNKLRVSLLEPKPKPTAKPDVKSTIFEEADENDEAIYENIDQEHVYENEIQPPKFEPKKEELPDVPPKLPARLEWDNENFYSVSSKASKTLARRSTRSCSKDLIEHFQLSEKNQLEKISNV